jgi:predicted ATP-grasp superfamily ATP-dependent carboligase
VSEARPPAVVLQASGPNALAIIRGLGREGVPVIACDHDPHAVGLVSRYAGAAITANPLTEPERFVEDLLELGRGRGRGGVLYATHDEAIAALGPRQAEVDALFRRPWTPWPEVDAIMDKEHQHAVAREHGFPVPATVTPASEADLGAVARELRFPVVLKPRNAPEFRHRFRAHLLTAADPEELRRAWEQAGPYDPQVCEVIPGDDSRLWTYGSYRDAAGRALAAFTGRKLRQWPVGFGAARAAESWWDPDLAARCDALLDALGYHGISQVEVKRDERDGRDYLIEVNARAWLWIGLATECGVNLPLACWLDAVGRPRTWPPGHRSGRRWVLLTKHLVGSAGEIRRREWSPGPFLASLRPPVRDGVFDPRDPRPAFALYERHARRLWRRA